MAAVNDELIQNLRTRGFEADYVPTSGEARERILQMVPRGTTVMTGSSTTLEELGVIEALSHPDYEYLRPKIRAEPDSRARDRLRAQALAASWFLGSVNAITQDGVLVAADGSGSRVGGYAFGPANVLIVASTNKVVPTLEDAMQRIREIVTPMEARRMARTNHGGTTSPNKWLIYERELFPGRTHVLLVGEPLGF